MLSLDGNRPISEERLKAFENAIGTGLPEDYRQFLLENNGGTPKQGSHFSFVEHGKKTDSRLMYFYGLDRSRDENIEVQIKIRTGRMPREVIPIAADPFGNEVCLVIHGREAGVVYFWNHEEESEDEPTYDNMYRIAGSFTELLDGLHPLR